MHPRLPVTAPPPRRHHRRTPGHRAWLNVGRVAVALIAVLVLAVTGLEWAIKSRADSGILSRSIQAIVTDDTNISTAAGRAGRPRCVRRREHPAARLGHPGGGGQRRRPAAPTKAPRTAWPTRTRLMIAHISSDRQHVTVLSIPRDTMIDAPTCKTWDASTGQLSGDDLPGQFRRQVAHQLRLLRRRPAVHRPRDPGPHRAADRPGDRDRLRRVPEHGRRAGRHHRERLRADRRRRAGHRRAQRRRADHRRRAGAQPGPGPEGGRATPTPTWPASAGSRSCCPRSCSR